MRNVGRRVASRTDDGAAEGGRPGAPRVPTEHFDTRELAPEEQSLVPELRKAYTRVRETFEPRVVAFRRPVRKVKSAPELDDFPEIDTGEDDDFGDLSASVFDSGDDDGDSAALMD